MKEIKNYAPDRSGFSVIPVLEASVEMLIEMYKSGQIDDTSWNKIIEQRSDLKIELDKNK